MVTLADFKRYLDRNAGTDLAQVGPEVASAMLDQYIEEIVLSEHAATHGVEIPAEKIASAVRTEAGSTVIEKRDEMRRQKLIADLAGSLRSRATSRCRPTTASTRPSSAAAKRCMSARSWSTTRTPPTTSPPS